MRKTLFFYIFKDLLKVFLLSSGALAGIMSFGGLLRPLTQHNLAIAQVGQMLGYFMPAMTNYSWPIAALFATTFVYGRLSADNELTACRAAGMSYSQMLVPAMMLGTIVTLLSAFFLAIVVPRSFLQAEKIIYSNLAQLVASQIDRTQRISLNSPQQSVTLFARSADVLEPNAARPDLQAVELHDVAIVTYSNEKAKDQPKVPREFYQAESATAYIEMPKDADGDVQITTQMINGGRTSRAGGDGSKQSLVNVSVETSIAGPFPLVSPVRETAKFMDIFRLTELRKNPEGSKRMQRSLAELATVDQRTAFIKYLAEELRAGRSVLLSGNENGKPATYTIEPPQPIAGARGPSITISPDDVLTIADGTPEKPGVVFRSDGAVNFSGRAHEVVLHANPNADAKLIYAKIEVRDATLMYREQESTLVSREWNVSVPMPERISKLSGRTVKDYFADRSDVGIARQGRLQSDYHRQTNQIESELHARFGFAFSCFALAIVGAAIGMLFKSGNFVSAFAVSVGPALLSIVLIVTGQHICESVPKDVGKNFHDPLNTGLLVLWLGNVLVVALGAGLLMRLRRT
jgi:lipopolysaccharide export LptBFGC system permease protein LptF